MPCRDDGGFYYNENLEAMLCGMTTALAKQNMLDQVLDAIDWLDAGITRHDFNQWWDLHLQIDAARLRREAEDRRREEFRLATLKKLSVEERTALGLV